MRSAKEVQRRAVNIAMREVLDDIGFFRITMNSNNMELSFDARSDRFVVSGIYNLRDKYFKDFDSALDYMYENN